MSSAARASMRVLLAEDTPISADMMAAMAKSLGVELDIAENGAEAINMACNAAASGKPYELLLLDVMMPVLDGIETTRRIRAMGFDAQSLPIIAVTAATDHDEVRLYHEAGMQAFLSKPLRLADLKAALNAWGWGTTKPNRRPENASWQGFLEQFAERKRTAIANIKQALAADNLDQETISSLRAMLHQLAGTAGSFGESELSEQSRMHEADLVSAHLNNGDVKAVLREAQKSLEK